MAAAKSLVAAALLALSWSAVAFADAPTVKIEAADQAVAAAALLHKSDFGAGWRGGTVKTTPVSSPNCPGFDPKESDLVVSGHAQAKFTFLKTDIVELDQDVQVLTSADAVRKDFARTIRPQLAACLTYQLKKAKNVVGVTVVRNPFPETGSGSASYRATISVHGPKGTGKFISDYVFFSSGRVEYAFNVIAPVAAGDQLVRFESAMAQILLKRVGVTAA